MKYLYLVITLIIYALMLAANFFSTKETIAWLNMGDLTEKFPFEYMPPGIAFGFSWGLIYLLVSIYVITLIYRIFTKTFTDYTKKEMLVFSGINILNISRILAISFELYILGTIIIFILYAFLVYFLKKFAIDISKKLAFGIYTGWITVASFGLSTPQIVYIISPETALSNIFGNFILIFSAIIAGITYWKIKNPYALFWSLLAVIITLLQFYKVIAL